MNLPRLAMICARTRPDLIRQGWSGRRQRPACWSGPRRKEGPTVSLSQRQLRTLRRMERDMAGTDPRLDELFLLFTQGFQGCEMPPVERVARWPSRMLARFWRGP